MSTSSSILATFFNSSRSPASAAGIMAASIVLTDSPICPISMRARSRARDGVLISSLSRYLALTASFSSRGLSGTTHSQKRANTAAKGRNSRAMPTLNTVWALATWRGVSAASLSMPDRPGSAAGEILRMKSANGGMNHTMISTPTILKVTWATATRTASRGLPMEARPAVAQVPMLAPRARAIPASRVISPCSASAMTTPMVAEDDCTSAVNAVATRMPIRGLETFCIRSMNGW